MQHKHRRDETRCSAGATARRFAPTRHKHSIQFFGVLCVVVAGVAVLVFFLPWLRGDLFFWFGDVARQNYPAFAYAASRLRIFELPHWNPYLLLGYPFIAEGQAGVFYPPTGVLAWVGSSADGYVAGTISAYVLAAAGAASLARLLGAAPPAAIFAGIAYGLSGEMTAAYRHYNLLHAAAWIPWVLAAEVRLLRGFSYGSMLVLALTVALQILAGHPQLSLFTLASLFVLPLFLIRRSAGAPYAILAAWGSSAAGVGVAAVQWLPTLMLSAHSRRMAEAGPELAAQFSLPLPGLASYLLPRLFEDPVWADVSFLDISRLHRFDLAGYAGIATLGLAAIAIQCHWGDRRTRGIAWLTAGALVLALGGSLLAYPLLVRFPGFGLFRGSSRLQHFATLGLALLAATGMTRILDEGCRTIRRRTALGLLITATMLVASGFAVRQAAPSLAPLLVARLEKRSAAGQAAYTERIDRVLAALERGLSPSDSRALTQLALLLSMTAILSLPAGRATAPALSLLLFCDLTINCQPRVHSIPRSLIGTVPEHVDSIAALVGRHGDRALRIAPGVPAQDPIWPLLTADATGYYSLFAIPLPEGVWPLADVRVDRMIRALHEPENGLPFRRRLADLIGVRAIFGPQGIDGPGLRVVSSGPIRVYHNEAAFPHVFLVSACRVVPDAFRAIVEPSIDLRREVVVDEPDPECQPAAASALDVEPPSWSAPVPEELRIAVDTRAAAWVVVASAFDLGWRASIDGRAVAVRRGDFALQTLPVPIGSHQVVLRYRTPGLHAGAVTTGMTVALLALLGVYEPSLRMRRT